MYLKAALVYNINAKVYACSIFKVGFLICIFLIHSFRKEIGEFFDKKSRKSLTTSLCK